MNRILTRTLAIALFVALLGAPAAFAQDTPPPPPPQQEAPQVEIDFTDDELDSFAEAYVDVEELQARYQAEFGTVDDPEEAQQIQQRFQSEVNQAIEGQGIDAERYDQIIQATQVDPEFTEGVLVRIEEARSERIDG